MAPIMVEGGNFNVYDVRLKCEEVFDFFFLLLFFLFFRSHLLLIRDPFSKNTKTQTGEGPLCYDFSKLDRYLSQPEVRKGLNVDPDAPWQECNMEVNHDMLVDFMR